MRIPKKWKKNTGSKSNSQHDNKSSVTAKVTLLFYSSQQRYTEPGMGLSLYRAIS